MSDKQIAVYAWRQIDMFLFNFMSDCINSSPYLVKILGSQKD